MLSESLDDVDNAMVSFESVLKHNSGNMNAITQLATIYRLKEQYGKSIECLKHILAYEKTNGQMWCELGHCYLMVDDLQQAFAAYQNALHHLPNPEVS